MVAGAGVNVDQARDELPVDTATSLRLAGCTDVRREDLLVAYLDHLAGLHARAGAAAARRCGELRAAVPQPC